MSVEQEIRNLEAEVKAIKASFEQNATTMTIHSAQVQFSTSPNYIQWNGNGHHVATMYPWLESLSGLTSDLSGNHTGYGRERFIVTFRCNGGNNTFASLEIDPVNQTSMPIVWAKRIPYSGGARWEVLVWDNGDYDSQGNYTWEPNIFNIAVQSAIAGTLEVKMAWQ